MDFTKLDDAWVEKEVPLHNDRDMRLKRFLRWCQEAEAETIVAVTHGLVCQHLLGVSLAQADVLGVRLQRATGEWSALEQEGPSGKTLRDTVAYGTLSGVALVLEGPPGRLALSSNVLGGWSMLHHAVAAGREEVVALLLERKADPDQTGECNYTAVEVAEWYLSRQKCRAVRDVVEMYKQETVVDA